MLNALNSDVPHFLAKKLARYVVFSSFISDMKENEEKYFNDTGSSFETYLNKNKTPSLQELFDNYFYIFPTMVKLNEIRSLLMTHIQFDTLSTLYVDKVSSPTELTEDMLKLGIKKINSDYHQGVDTHFENMIAKGVPYNFLDQFQPTKPQGPYFPVIELKNNHLRILLYYPIGTSKSGHTIDKILASVIDFDIDNMRVMQSVHNETELFSEVPFTLDGLHKNGLQMLEKYFKIAFVDFRILVSHVRKQLYDITSNINLKILEPIKNDVRQKIDENEFKKFHTNLVEPFEKLENNHDVIKTIEEKSFNNLLAEHVIHDVSKKVLKDNAIKAGQPGYLTMIKFNGDSGSQASAKSSDRLTPIVKFPIYYSLQDSIDAFKSISLWRIAWFESFLNDDTSISPNEVMQMTIEATSTKLKMSLGFRQSKNKDRVLGEDTVKKILNYLFEYLLNEEKSDD